MTKILSYKYINLLGRILIGGFAILLIVVKLQEEFIDKIFDKSLNIQFGLLFFAFIFVFFNWGIEAFKWKYLIQDIERIDFFTALKLTITSVTIGIITPNRLGEVPGRAILLKNKENLKDLVVKTSVGAFSQLIVTLLFGTIAVFFTLNLFKIPFNVYQIYFFLTGTTFLLMLTYFYNKAVKQLLYKIAFLKKKEFLKALDSFSFSGLLAVLSLSALRYMVFSFQYYLVLLALGIDITSFTELLLIPFCFLITSAIPTILISEIGVRGSVALFVFGVISDHSLAILISSILLWLINVAFPAIMGLFFINRLKIITTK